MLGKVLLRPRGTSYRYKVDLQIISSVLLQSFLPKFIQELTEGNNNICSSTVCVYFTYDINFCINGFIHTLCRRCFVLQGISDQLLSWPLDQLPTTGWHQLLCNRRGFTQPRSSSLGRMLVSVCFKALIYLPTLWLSPWDPR